MKRAVVLLSGGLDSATTLAIAKNQGYECYALTINYGQRHKVEIEAATQVAKSNKVHQQQVSVALDAWGGSALTGGIDVPKDSLADIGIPVTYVPARNTVMLSLALSYAEVLGASDIFVGVNAVDYSGYPDCRPEFIEKFQELARVATKAGIEGDRIQIHAPLMRWSKEKIVKEGLALGVDFGETHSCYDPGLNGEPCQHCDSCIIRIRAFEKLGLTDPALTKCKI